MCEAGKANAKHSRTPKKIIINVSKTRGALPCRQAGIGFALIFLCYFLCIKAKKVRERFKSRRKPDTTKGSWVFAGESCNKNIN